MATTSTSTSADIANATTVAITKVKQDVTEGCFGKSNVISYLNGEIVLDLSKINNLSDLTNLKLFFNIYNFPQIKLLMQNVQLEIVTELFNSISKIEELDELIIDFVDKYNPLLVDKNSFWPILPEFPNIRTLTVLNSDNFRYSYQHLRCYGTHYEPITSNLKLNKIFSSRNLVLVKMKDCNVGLDDIISILDLCKKDNNTIKLELKSVSILELEFGKLTQKIHTLLTKLQNYIELTGSEYDFNPSFCGDSFFNIDDHPLWHTIQAKITENKAICSGKKVESLFQLLKSQPKEKSQEILKEIEELRKFLHAQNNHNSDYYFGCLYVNSGDYIEAFRCFTRVSHTNPNFIDSMHRAMMLLQQEHVVDKAPYSGSLRTVVAHSSVERQSTDVVSTATMNSSITSSTATASCSADEHLIKSQTSADKEKQDPIDEDKKIISMIKVGLTAIAKIKISDKHCGLHELLNFSLNRYYNNELVECDVFGKNLDFVKPIFSRLQKIPLLPQDSFDNAIEALLLMIKQQRDQSLERQKEKQELEKVYVAKTENLQKELANHAPTAPAALLIKEFSPERDQPGSFMS